MACHYVYHGGDNTGTTSASFDNTKWTTAWQSLQDVDSNVSSGDTVYVASDHVKSYGSAHALITWANPCHVISVDRTTGAFTAQTASYGESTNSSYYYYHSIPTQQEVFIEGLHFNAVAGAVSPSNGNAGGRVVCRKCLFTTSSYLSNASNNGVYYDTCTFNKSSGTNAFYLIGGRVVFDSCEFQNTSSASCVASFGTTTNVGGYVDFRNCDLSGFSNLVDTAASATAIWGTARFFRCKLATSYAVFVSGDTVGPSQSVIIDECYDGTKTNSAAFYAESRTYTAQGSPSKVSFDTTTARTGSVDGVTNYSVKAVTNANCSRYGFCEVQKEFAVWHPGTGAHTLKIYLASSDSGLDDGQLYAKIESPSETDPAPAFGRFINTRPDYGAEVAAGTSTYLKNVSDGSNWSGTPGTTYQIVVDDLDPTEAGWVYVRMYIAKASTTVYIDPALELTAN